MRSKGPTGKRGDETSCSDTPNRPSRTPTLSDPYLPHPAWSETTPVFAVCLVFTRDPVRLSSTGPSSSRPRPSRPRGPVEGCGSAPPTRTVEGQVPVSVGTSRPRVTGRRMGDEGPGGTSQWRGRRDLEWNETPIPGSGVYRVRYRYPTQGPTVVMGGVRGSEDGVPARKVGPVGPSQPRLRTRKPPSPNQVLRPLINPRRGPGPPTTRWGVGRETTLLGPG